MTERHIETNCGEGVRLVCDLSALGVAQRKRRFLLDQLLQVDEPLHVHVERDIQRAKFWLDPVRLARSGRLGAAELQHLERLVIAHEQLFLRTWNEHFTITD